MSFTYTDYEHGKFDPTANALGAVAVLSDTLKLALIDTTLYTADPDADVSLDDIPGAAIVATATITGSAVGSRAFTWDPVVFPLLTGAEVGAAVAYMDTGTPSTSPLITYLDDYDSGVPFEPDGTDFTWNPDAAGVITV